MKAEETITISSQDASESSAASPPRPEGEIEYADGAPKEKEERQPLNLINLPPELLQTILWHMEPGACFTALQTCKTFHTNANIRKLLLHQISHLPGLRLGLDELQTEALSSTFRTRAARNAVAAKLFSDTCRYEPFGPESEMSKCALVHGPVKPPYLAVPVDKQRINVYWLGSKFVRLKAEGLKPRERKSRDLEIVHMAFSEGKDLAVLYSCKPSARPRHVFDDKLGSKRKYKLVTFLYTKTSNRSSFYKNSMQETRDVTAEHHDSKPVGLALANNGTACITWQRWKDCYKTEVWIYGRHKEILDNTSHDPMPRTSLLPSNAPCFGKRKDNLISHAQFSPASQTIIFHSPGFPIYSWYSNNTEAGTTFNLEGTTAENLHEINLLPVLPSADPPANNADSDDEDAEDAETDIIDFRVGVPFSAQHTRANDTLCRMSYLSVGIAPQMEHSGSNAFVIHSEVSSPPALCSHTADCWEGRRQAGSGRRAIAVLAGYPRGESSIGTVIATSPNANRIAAASWREVKVWTLAPSIFHQSDHNLLQQWFPARDFNSRRSIGRLRPVILPAQGVIYKLCWESEEVLYAVCDNGLVKWDLGHLCSGEREEFSLLHDACGSMNLAALGRHVKKGKVRIEGLTTDSEEEETYDDDDRDAEDSPEDDD